MYLSIEAPTTTSHIPPTHVPTSIALIACKDSFELVLYSIYLKEWEKRFSPKQNKFTQIPTSKWLPKLNVS